MNDPQHQRTATTALIEVDTWQTQAYNPLTDALELAEEALRLTTGHNDYQRQKIAYWIVATHFLPVFDPFLQLVVYGPPSTGKSATIDVVAELALKVVPVSGSTLTKAALKAAMAEAELGTLIIEEADDLSTQELENILITRYSRSTGRSTKMVCLGDRDWVREVFKTFGATALHRRNLFREPALLRRVMPVRTIRTIRTTDDDYISVSSCSPLFKQFNALAIFASSIDSNHCSTGDKLPKLPEVKNVWGIEPGIFDCYKPLVAIATHLCDSRFLSQLVAEMEEASQRLRNEETYLEAPILLHILVGLADEEMQGRFTLKRLALEANKIVPAVLKEFGASCPLLSLAANQRNRILRDDLGFEVVSAGGKMRVRFTIAQLLAKCKEYNVEDELLSEWDKKLKELAGGETS